MHSKLLTGVAPSPGSAGGMEGVGPPVGTLPPSASPAVLTVTSASQAVLMVMLASLAATVVAKSSSGCGL